MNKDFPIILGLDFGTQRVGVAIARTSLAEPLTILEQSPQLIPQLTTLIHDHHVTQVVIGRSEGAMAAQTETFANQLAKEIDIPISFVDETLTSHDVHQKLRELSPKERRAHHHIDDLAAAEILQSYLDG